MEEEGKKTYQEKIEAQLKGFASQIEGLVAKADQAKKEAKAKQGEKGDVVHFVHFRSGDRGRALTEDNLPCR